MKNYIKFNFKRQTSIVFLYLNERLNIIAKSRGVNKFFLDYSVFINFTKNCIF